MNSGSVHFKDLRPCCNINVIVYYIALFSDEEGGKESVPNFPVEVEEMVVEGEVKESVED